MAAMGLDRMCASRAITVLVRQAAIRRAPGQRDRRVQGRHETEPHFARNDIRNASDVLAKPSLGLKFLVSGSAARTWTP
jgi:hypothetical protein